MLTAAAWLAGANPLVALAPSGLYLADTATTLARRALRGESLFDAHREHAYQRLAVAWGGHTPAAAFYAVLQVALCFVAWLTTR